MLNLDWECDFALDEQARIATRIITQHATALGAELVRDVLNAQQKTEVEVEMQRTRITEIKSRLNALPAQQRRQLEVVCEALVRKSVWIIGGDGW